MPIDEVTDSFHVRYGSELGLPNEVAEAITRRQAAHQEQLLADDPIGREIAKLEAEKDRLLDTIWLATSPTQIKQLWTKVGELLGDEPTTLEREALAIEPARRRDVEETTPSTTPTRSASAPSLLGPARTASAQPASRAPGSARPGTGSCRGWRGPRRSGTSTS